MLEARKHLRFVISLYREQETEGRYWLHEHPQGAASWQEPAMVELLAFGHAYVVNANMCQFGMTSSDEDGEGLVFKPTKFATNCEAIANQLERKCHNSKIDKPHRHVRLLQGRALAAQVYPPELCRAICKGL